ncbi:asparagine synthase (glutamine-hydrolyzing) [Geomonas sp. RF6]|uniref:asparagine synthase (glutamine-hydrolyzing) n=1 Tax=Geomonas sp. RF6 TaxID=2897342 RepID=UPI001E654A11|nr:asparagine synthase (glutamine-hydrolyzing) [Geomonas sp. RF6]UFS72430.1 asparagine synthase (glutamine-hydrolyzing) [Geomonas sp. RF6]
MCGIAGIYSFRGTVERRDIDALTDALAHRGPDGRGIHLEPQLALGHRRLAILDPREVGACPMRYRTPDGRELFITFNGEVYNFLEIRAELEAQGYRFATETDTEVIVAAYARWGEECLTRFNGMWAFAVWESARKTLFLARDRFSVKPLYYAVHDNALIFASEMKAFSALPGFPAQLDVNVVPDLLANSYALEGTREETLMAGVKRLLGGHCLTVNGDGSATMRRWWDSSAHLPQVAATYREQVEEFRELFFDALRIRMRSDVPLGTCLSGGIDSSAVASGMAWLKGNDAASLKRCPEDWQRSFIATFPGTMLDERQYADEVVGHTGAVPRYWVFDPEEAVSHVVDSVWAMEEVYGGLAVPVWCIYRELRRDGVYVSLDGHGGDELLGGYTWYLDWPMERVNENLYNDVHYTLLPAILRNYDRCSMAHGIEVRMPLLDWRLVTYALALPPSAKMGGGYTKRVLRDALEGIMPDRVRQRQSKIGFNSPMIEWFNGGMAPLIDKVTSHKLWLDSPFWEGRAMREHIMAKTRARGWSRADWGESLRVWTLMNLVLWQMLFVEKTDPRNL